MVLYSRQVAPAARTNDANIQRPQAKTKDLQQAKTKDPTSIDMKDPNRQRYKGSNKHRYEGSQQAEINDPNRQ